MYLHSDTLHKSTCTTTSGTCSHSGLIVKKKQLDSYFLIQPYLDGLQATAYKTTPDSYIYTVCIVLLQASFALVEMFSLAPFNFLDVGILQYF